MMKNFVFLQLLVLSFFANASFADCLFSDKIITTRSGTYPAYEITYNDGTKGIWLKDAESERLTNLSNNAATNDNWTEPGLVNNVLNPVGKDGKAITTGRELTLSEIDQNKTTPAVFACESKGVHLPTKDAYRNLLRCGFSTIIEKFNGVEMKWFWSSSVSPSYTIGAFRLDGFDGTVDYGNGRNDHYDVRCVGQL